MKSATTMLKIRTAQKSDFGFVRKGIETIIQMSGDLPHFSDAENRMRKCYEEMLDDKNHHLVIAEHEGKPVGLAVCAFTKALHLGGWGCELQDLYVDKSARQGGVGRALVRYVEDFCHRNGVKAIQLVQPPPSSTMHEERTKFYDSVGYKTGPILRSNFFEA